MKFEVTESKLSLLLKHNIMHVEKHSCEQLLCTYKHSAIKVIKFESKENYFETQAAGFVRLPYLVEKGKKVSKRFTSYYSTETR